MYGFGLPNHTMQNIYSVNDVRTFTIDADSTSCMSYVHTFCDKFMYDVFPGYMYVGEFGSGFYIYENETEFHVGDRLAVYCDGDDGHEMMVYATEDNGHTAYLIDNGAYIDRRKFEKTGDYKYLARISMGSDEVLVPDRVWRTGIRGWEIYSRILF